MLDWLQRMNGAISYIENNLTSEIKYEELSKIVCCSIYHFQKMFSFLTDVPLSEYIRRRRLTQAAYELRNSNIKVIDLAYKYGYESPDSFTRAFQNLHGVTPTLARDLGVILKAYPRMSFHISIKGDIEMNYKIEDKNSFSVVGRKLRVSTINGENNSIIPKFWDKCDSNGVTDKICKLSRRIEDKQTGMNLLGICVDVGVPNEFDYWIGIETESDTVSSEFENIQIPSATWAIFEVVGPMPSAIQNMWKRIFTEFFPESGYERSNLPDLELYPPGDSNSPNFKTEIWVPIIKK